MEPCHYAAIETHNTEGGKQQHTTVLQFAPSVRDLTHRHDRSDIQSVSRSDRCGTVHKAKDGKGTFIRHSYTHNTRMSHSRLGSCNYVQTASKSSSHSLLLRLTSGITYHVSSNVHL
jgi:hypothetical protein